MTEKNRHPAPAPATTRRLIGARALAVLWLALLAATACSPTAPDRSSGRQESDGVSILRPEIEPPAPDPVPQARVPYRAVITFAEGGTRLDADAVNALEAALASPEMAQGLPIILRAHSDSAGGDGANLDASEQRGLAVAQWLIEKGVDADRITVVAFGEQNPAQPNALPDGSPNEAGRAANRRVEIEIAQAPPDEDAPEQPSPSVEAGD